MSTRSKQLLDYFVSEQLQRVGYLNSERSGRLLVDDEFEFGGLHDRKVGGLCSLEDLTGVEADLAACVRKIDPMIGTTGDPAVESPTSSAALVSRGTESRLTAVSAEIRAKGVR